MKKIKHLISPHQRHMLLPISRHEVGHYITARVLGFKTGKISLVFFDLIGGHHGTAEIVLCFGLRDMQSMEDYIERRVTVLYSGALAESLHNGQIDNDYAINAMRQGGAQNDFAKAKELIQILRNIRFPDTTVEEEVQKNLDVIDNQLWNNAAHIVLTESALIEGIGSRLASDIKYTNEPVILSHEELEALPAIRDRFST